MDPIKYTHQELFHNERAANQILPYIFNLFQINSIIDIGCGTGSWLSSAEKLGVNKILGVDGIKVIPELIKIKNENFILHDLRLPLSLNQKFDLCICLEVVEHLPESAAVTIVNTLCSHSDLILFSAAIPNQTGDHHINEQWPSYWQNKFKENGFYALDILRLEFWNNQDIEWWYRQNLLIYTNNEKYLQKFNKTENVTPLVHPELLLMKEGNIQHFQNIIEDHIIRPRFFSALKKLYKSIFNV